MIIYRGVKNILFKQIDPLFKNTDDFHLDYGSGTSYAYEKSLAYEYCQFGRALKYSWVLQYTFIPKSTLTISLSSCVDEDCLDFGIFINGDVIKKKDLVKFAETNNYDCIYFEYDENDPHLLLTSLAKSEQLELICVELFSENQKVVDSLTKMKLQFDGQYFQVPLNKINEVDLILSNF
jgi:hypothetical protein